MINDNEFQYRNINSFNIKKIQYTTTFVCKNKKKNKKKRFYILNYILILMKKGK